MSLSSRLKQYAQHEEGAVTVDWVFLTAALVGLALLTISTMETASSSAITATASKMSDI